MNRGCYIRSFSQVIQIFFVDYFQVNSENLQEFYHFILVLVGRHSKES